MPNYGNTGQRYTMSVLVALEAKENKVLHTLACGHSYEATWETPEAAARSVTSAQHRIGKCQRCMQCQK